MTKPTDIVAIRTAREVLLIGPRASLATLPERDRLGEADVRRRLLDAMSDVGDPDRLRRALGRWGLDTQRTNRTRDVQLLDRVARLVGTGALSACATPEIATAVSPTARPLVLKGPAAAAVQAACATGARAEQRSSRDRASPVIRAARGAGPLPPPLAAAATVLPAGFAAKPIEAEAPRVAVQAMALEDRFALVLARATESDRLAPEVREELRALIAPETIATTVLVLVAWAASHATPFGYVFDAGMVGLGLFFAGQSALEAAETFAQFMTLTVKARTEEDLDQAADLLAVAIAVLSVRLFAKLISRGASGINSGGKAKRVRAKVDRPTNPAPRTPVGEREASRPTGAIAQERGAQGGRSALPHPPPTPAGKPPATPERRAELNRKFGRTGDLNRDINTRGDLEKIYRRAPDAKREIDELADRVAGEFGGTVAKAPLKGKQRALQKIAQDYDGDASRITDIARNTIVVPADKVSDVTERLRQSGAKVKIVAAEADDLGYSGANSKLKTGSGITGEIQVNSPEMIFAKEKPADARRILGDQTYDAIADKVGVEGGRGHALYERARVLPVGSPELGPIQADSKAYYDHIRRTGR